MNRILILFLFFSGFCISQNFEAGPIIGINTSQVSFDNLAGFNKLGLRIGAFVNRKFNKFDGQIELQYINKGSREKINNNTYNEGYRFQLNYIEIPEEEFYETLDKFRPEHLWEKKGNDYILCKNWVLKHKVK